MFQVLMENTLSGGLGEKENLSLPYASQMNPPVLKTQEIRIAWKKI